MTTRAADLEQQAIDRARRGDFGVAARDLNQELTKLSTDNAGAWTRLARCCLELGQLDEATAAIDAVLTLNPQNTIARNMQLDITRRRTGPAAAAAPRRRTVPRQSESGAGRRERVPRARSSASPVSGIARQEFTTLGHLSADAALDALTPRLEPLLMAVNERPFAQKIVEARNRAAHAANALFRRNSFQPGSAGHLYAFHYGGRWEPQANLGLLSSHQWRRDAVRAGIGFNLTPAGIDPDPEGGQQRALDYFSRFQQLISSSWRQLLTAWMGTQGGFIQYGANPPATDLLPNDAVAWLVNVQNPAEVGWIFCGRWLFADHPDHAVVLGDGRRLVEWIDQTFSDLLPLWATVYRP